MPSALDWDEAEVRLEPPQETERTDRRSPARKIEESEGVQPAVPSATPAAEGIGEAPATARAINPLSTSSRLKIRRRPFKQQFKAGEIVVNRRLFRGPARASTC